jgi:hypothetical protein
VSNGSAISVMSISAFSYGTGSSLQSFAKSTWQKAYPWQVMVSILVLARFCAPSSELQIAEDGIETKRSFAESRRGGYPSTTTPEIDQFS